jgi:signal transduction histidine kinase
MNYSTKKGALHTMKSTSQPVKITKQILIYVVELLTLFVIYFTTARFGLSLGAVSGFATLVWFPSGTALAALLLFGYRLWPAILLGAFLANLFNGAPLWVALGIGTGNTLEALLGAFLLKRYGLSYTFDHLRDVLLLVLLAMPLSAIISATIGVTSLLLGKSLALSSYVPTWSAWWIGDMISILILTPFFLTWSTWSPAKISIQRMAEIGIFAVFVLAVGLITFFSLLHTDQRTYALTYLVFPPLIWAALRFGPRGTLTAILALSSLAIIGTSQGLISFSSGNLSVNLFFLQCFMGIIAITSMILAAVVAERKELERQKDEFIAMANHELKTPVTSLKGFAQFLQRRFAKAGDEESAKLLLKMDAQVNKLISLIEDLLDITRIEAGKLQFHDDYFPFDELVDEIVEEVQHVTEKHAIIREGLAEKMVYADKDRIGQVITNFLTNAIKYSADSDQITVNTSATNHQVSLSVKDYGLGIAKEQQPYVFERFYRVSDTTGRTYPGLGIGLYISREIIKRQGGRIWVISEKGKGSTFGFTIPVGVSHPSKILDHSRLP